MEGNEKTGLIYAAIAEAMDACNAVAKNSKNPQQGYMYRGIDAVYNAVNPAFTKAKIFSVPEVIETSREERETRTKSTLIYSIVKVRYTFYATDGSNVSAVVVGEGMDSGDKSFNKAMSAAYKYALFQVLCIPTEEMVDSETDSPEPVLKSQQKPPVQQRQTVTQTQPKQTASQPKNGNVEMEHPTAQDIKNLASEVANKVDPNYRSQVKAVFESQPDGWQKTALESNNAKSFNDFDEKTVDKFGNIFKSHNLMK